MVVKKRQPSLFSVLDKGCSAFIQVQQIAKLICAGEMTGA